MVSVVIPLYNAEPYIERCIDSVINQSYKDWEIVIVDDASTDGSLRIVEKYKTASTNIRIVKHEHNKGLMFTRHDGYKAAKGDFLLFLDADDCLPIDALIRLVVKQKNTGADIVMGNLQKIYVRGKKERRKGCLHNDQCASPTEVLSALLNQRIIHSLCGKLYKTSLFKQSDLHTFEHLTIAEDACLLYQLVTKAERIASVNAYTYYYYENRASASHHAYGAEQIENIIVAYKTMAEVCAPYVPLREQVKKRLTRESFLLFCERLPMKEVQRLLAKHHLLEYGSLSYAIKYLGINDLCFFMKRYVYCRIIKRN